MYNWRLQVVKAKDEFVRELHEHCDPTGITCSKCCLLYLESTLKGDPCWEGVMRESTQYVVSDHWKNDNVTRMLLKCEQQHDLDALLASEDDGQADSNEGHKTFESTGLLLAGIISKYMLDN